MSRGPGGGRRALPTAVKNLRGNPGKRPVNKAEPKPKSTAPAMPEGLPPLAIAEWKSIVPMLSLLGVLTEVDGKALAAYCEYFAQWREALDEVRTRGITLEEPITKTFGETTEVVGYKYKRNPAVSIANDAAKLMKSFLVEFGLTPSSRGRLKIDAAPGEEDPMDAYLRAAALPVAKKNDVN
jgi:P27 family predicted phage terminase small subunit